jgi:hypothetical protein
VAVNADGKYLDLLFVVFCQKAFQLPELLCAVRSPLAAVKNQDDILLASEIGQGNSIPVHVLQREVWRRLSYMNSFKVCVFQVAPVFGAQLGMGYGT